MVKGIDQRNLRWVEIVTNQQVFLHCWGTGHSVEISKGHHPGFLQKKVFLPLESRLLVLWERIGETLKMGYCAYKFGKNMVLAPVGGALYGV